MMRLTQLWPFMLVLLFTLSGCGTTQPSKFYLLNATGETAESGNTSFNVGLGPIKFPAYLDRSRIMVRTGNNSYKAAEYHRWAEPLEVNFTRVLAQDLRNTLPDATITTYPWRNTKKIDMQIQLEVLNFDSDDKNKARLDVRWELIDADKKRLGTPQQRRYLKSTSSDDYEARVAAMSESMHLDRSWHRR